MVTEIVQDVLSAVARDARCSLCEIVMVIMRKTTSHALYVRELGQSQKTGLIGIIGLRDLMTMQSSSFNMIDWDPK